MTVHSSARYYIVHPTGEKKYYDTTSLARKASGELAAENIGIDILVYEISGEVAWVTHMKYAKDDPIWHQYPSYDDCRMLYAYIIRRAMYDATLGAIAGHHTMAILTIEELDKAKYYLMSSEEFLHDCEHLNINPNKIRDAVNDANSGKSAVIDFTDF